MKALILDGSRAGDGAVQDAHRVLAGQLGDRGCDVESLPLRRMEIGHCVGCFGCWVQTPGVCVIDDSAGEVARAFMGSDLVALLTPVTFGGYSYELKKALDRIICVLSPFFLQIGGEVHHEPRYDRYPRLLGLGVLPEPDADSEDIFITLVGRNAINMHAPVHAAGVVHIGQSADEVGRTVGSLIAHAEVGA
jgi:hypothetical protein